MKSNKSANKVDFDSLLAEGQKDEEPEKKEGKKEGQRGRNKETVKVKYP